MIGYGDVVQMHVLCLCQTVAMLFNYFGKAWYSLYNCILFFAQYVKPLWLFHCLKDYAIICSILNNVL